MRGEKERGGIGLDVPCEIVGDRFCGFDQLVVYDETGVIVDDADTCELFAVFSQTLDEASRDEDRKGERA